MLEDRYADALIGGAVAQGGRALVARRARAWIDLNRDERELDPAMIESAPPGPFLATAKVRGGLGLIPRRIAGAGDIYRQHLAATDVAARIAGYHRPWHDEVAAALAAAHCRFGVAVLLDVHSMPPGPQAEIVLGDRHGTSAADRFVARVEAEAVPFGLQTARNDPYSGGYTAERHGRPAADIHVVQLEIDRSLYLAPDLRTPSPALPRISRFVAAAARALDDEARSAAPALLAAE